MSGLPPLAKAGSQAPAILKNKRPNILLIVTDQERSWADLPNGLDLPQRAQLAQSASQFAHHHANAVACGPSRSVIYTGQHIQKTGVFDNPAMAPGRKDLDPRQTPTIGTMLQDNGYHTAYFGKWHLHDLTKKPAPDMATALQPFGFDEFRPPVPTGDTDGAAWEGWQLDPALAHDAVAWLQTQATGTAHKPWFMAVNLINPHDIRHFNATGHQGDGMHPHFASEMAGLPDIPFYQTDLGFDLPKSFPGAKPRPVVAHDLYVDDAAYFFGSIPRDDEAAWSRYQNYYFNCLRDVDRHIGTLLDGLKNAGLSDDTVIIFTSDHGEMGGAHGLRGKGPFLYKENFHLPMLIRHPDMPAGATLPGLSCALDLAPTILAAAGVTDEKRHARYPDLPGHNLLATGNGTPTRDGLLLMSSIVHCCNQTKRSTSLKRFTPGTGGKTLRPSASQRILSTLTTDPSCAAIMMAAINFAVISAPANITCPKTGPRWRNTMT